MFEVPKDRPELIYLWRNAGSVLTRILCPAYSLAMIVNAGGEAMDAA
jgi:hypothetical protein